MKPTDQSAIDEAVLLFVDKKGLNAINVVRAHFGFSLREARLFVRQEVRKAFGEEAAPIEEDFLVSEIDLTPHDNGAFDVRVRGNLIGKTPPRDSLEAFDDGRLWKEAYAVIRQYLLARREA